MICIRKPLDEYYAATNWYRNRDPEPDQRFITEVENAIAKISQAPNRWPTVEDDVRRCLTHVFPYAILYTLELESILILAIAHCPREPRYWLKRRSGGAYVDEQDAS